MDLANSQAAQAQTAQTDTATEAAQPEANAVPKLETIEKAYFSSSQLEAAQVAVGKAQEIATANGIEITYNFDIADDFPAGYGLAIDHIAKRGANGNDIIGIVVAAIPDYETIAAFEGGMAFIKEKTLESCMAKLKNAVRPRGEDNAVSASVPLTVTDFITSNRPEGVLVAFRTLAGAYVKMLKKKGLTLMTEAILRQTLQSKAFAEQNFPKITQDKWQTILDSMIEKAIKEQLAVGILEEWKATRDSAELPAADVDLSDLDFDKLA